MGLPGAVPALQGEDSSLYPPKSLLGQWQGFEDSFLEQKGKRSDPQSLQMLSKGRAAPSLHPAFIPPSIKCPGEDQPRLGAETPHKVPNGSQPCVPRGDARSWGQTHTSCVENNRRIFIRCFTTDQGICRRIFLGRRRVCV